MPLLKPTWRVPSAAAILLISSVLTILFWSILPVRYRLVEATDYGVFYEPVARSILAGNGFVLEGAQPATAFPPGYPLILAGVFGASHQLGLSEGFGLEVLALSCMALISVFIFLLARMFWGTRVGIVSSLLWMTYPFALWLTKQPNSEMPFSVLLYGGLCLLGYLLIRGKSGWPLYLLCGFVFGGAMLIRPIAIGIVFVLALIVWFARRDTDRKSRLLLISVLLLGNLVAVFPWEAWVYVKTGRVVLLSGHGANTLRLGLTYAVDDRKEISAPPDVDQVMKDIAARSAEINSFSDMVRVVTSEFRAHPIATTRLYLLKIARSWYGTDSGHFELPILLIQIPYLGFALWGLHRLWRRGGIPRNYAIGTLMIVIYFWSMTVLALSILRYMAPITGLLFIVIAAGLSSATKFSAQISRTFEGRQKALQRT